MIEITGLIHGHFTALGVIGVSVWTGVHVPGLISDDFFYTDCVKIECAGCNYFGCCCSIHSNSSSQRRLLIYLYHEAAAAAEQLLSSIICYRPKGGDALCREGNCWSGGK